jgi:hypothetical protein
MALYLVPIVALPILVAGFVVLVLTVKPPMNAQPQSPEATNAREAASALSGASPRGKPSNPSGASDLLCDDPLGCANQPLSR